MSLFDKSVVNAGSVAVLRRQTAGSGRSFSVSGGVITARTEQLAESASELGGQRRVENEVGRTVDHYQNVGHGRRQPEINALPWRR